MKDTVMDEMTDQDLANAIQANIALSIKLTTHAVKRACRYAGKGITAADVVVPHVSRALGHLWQAHADTTEAANAMPGVAPQFGGDK